MVKIQRTKRGQHTITLTKEVMSIMGWKKGDELLPGLTKQKDFTLKKKA